MIPRPGQGLADLAMKLGSAIAPETTSRFAAANSGLIAMLLGALAQDTERAIDARMTDIQELKRIFGDACKGACMDTPEDTDTPASPPNLAAMAAFRERQPDSLRLTDVDAVHGAGLDLLIELHAWAEAHDAELDTQIWDFLLRHTERHRLDAG